MSTEWPYEESASGEMPSAAPETGGLLRDLEDELCRLGGVLAVRVVGDRSDRPIEVHVLADQTKTPKQTVRDIRAVAHTVFGIELDHRIVSVAQLDTNESDTPVGLVLPTGERRVRVGAVHADTDGLRAEVRVTLVDDEREHVGYAEGSIAAVARPHLVATATLDALRQIEPAADAVHLASAEISRIGSNRVAVVTVVYVDPPLELFVSGSAVVRRERDEAIARALLDATNRRITRTEHGRATR
ncbi:MAG TPA: hypothetical protein VFZ17_10880 [Acidimicrobiia bacterium]|nr:hypothetical protein [Acidimicrobiia bacterium]